MTDIRKANIKMRDGASWQTEIDIDTHTPKSLAARMVSLTGGHVICRDKLWGNDRVLVINLADVSVIELVTP